MANILRFESNPAITMAKQKAELEFLSAKRVLAKQQPAPGKKPPAAEQKRKGQK